MTKQQLLEGLARAIMSCEPADHKPSDSDYKAYYILSQAVFDYLSPSMSELGLTLSAIDRLVEYGDGDAILKGSSTHKRVQEAASSLSAWREGSE